jgi:probable phosphoglycerate mutase
MIKMKSTKLVIARHGNTFKKDQIPRRIGKETDLSLVEEHKGRSIGKYLLNEDLKPDVVFSGPLKRHLQTASLACLELNIDTQTVKIEHDFTEIDYGPDENKKEEEVLLRLGNGNRENGFKIIEAWNRNAIVPDGWKVDRDEIIGNWIRFSNYLEKDFYGKNILLISSNGNMRFAPHLTGSFKEFVKGNDIKVSTGGVCVFEKNEKDDFWRCIVWNEKPYNNY